jgi:hypothetical protein
MAIPQSRAATHVTPRRLLIGEENPGGEQRAQSTKLGAEIEDQMLFILTPEF